MMRGDLLTRVISSASEKSFSFAVMKEMGGHQKTGNAVLHTLWAHGVSFAKEKASGKRKSTLGGAWEANLRPFGAPPSIGRRESRVPASLPHTVISSASEKSFSFAVKKKQENIGKRETPYSIRSWLTVSFAKETVSGQRKALSAASMRRGFF